MKPQPDRRPSDRQELDQRDRRLMAMLDEIPSNGLSSERDWFSAILWALVILTAVGGALLLWVLAG
ncbi:MAG: hypothetical protein ACTHJK_13390 [Sphingomicrobium sp.]